MDLGAAVTRTMISTGLPTAPEPNIQIVCSAALFQLVIVAVERLGDDGVVGRFHDRGQQPLALGAMLPFGGGLKPDCSEQRTTGLGRAALSISKGETKTRGAEAVEPAGIKAEVEIWPR